MSTFKILSESTHALERPGMYIGSTTIEDQEHISFGGTQNSFQVVPGLLKIIEEIIQNSVDEAIRTEFEFATNIVVSIDVDLGMVHVVDDGRGIPVVEHEDGWQPVLCWTRARAGTSFEAERNTIGANGVGSFLTTVFSKKFIGISDDGNKRLNLEAIDNMSKVEFEVEPSKKRGTWVQFWPDLSRFGLEKITDDHVNMIEDRLKHLSICYPKINFSFNGEVISIPRKSIANLYSEHAVSSSNESSFFVVAPLPEKADGFKSVSYVNGIFLKNGGNHVNWFMERLCEAMRPLIKKKWKIDVTPSGIQTKILFASYVSGFPNLKFDSQAKERLTNTPKEVSDFLKVDTSEFEKLAKKVIDTHELINPIVEAILFKKKMEEAREAAKLAKQKKPRFANHIEAQGKDPSKKTIFICEGMSAMGPIISVRNAETTGAYALRGKVMNTLDKSAVQILKNKEYRELCVILGLEPNKSAQETSYGTIALLTDADPDGASIYNGLLAFFSNWPELFERGQLCRVMSPLYICRKGKEQKVFYTNEEYNEAKLGSSWEVDYIKGLGSLEEVDYDEVINKPRLVRLAPLNEKDMKYMEIAFGESAELRKEWLLGDNNA